MRRRAANGDLSVHAIAGSYVVLLGINIRESSPTLNGLLGFAIRKTDVATGRTGWLPGFKRFRSTPGAPDPAKLASTRNHPLQGFLWGDYGAKTGHAYVYSVVPLYGVPRRLQEGPAVEVRVETESESNGLHAVYFNRGAAASQAYVRKFGNRRPDRRRNPEAYPWLSRGLEEAMLAFIARAEERGWAIRAAVYEFHYDRVLAAFKAAADRGVDVRVVFDCKTGAQKPARRNLRAIRANGLHVREICRARRANSSFIAHNKFIVLLKDGEAREVWTGSTNITEGGIFGHSNLGHVARDATVADAYLRYWEQLSGDPEAKDLREWNDENSPVPTDRPPRGITPIFSPRGSVDALEYYASLMDQARSGVFFTAAFGVNPLLRRVLATDKPYLRYLLLEREDKPGADDPDIRLYQRDRQNLIAVGSHLTDNVLERWVRTNFAEEELTGKNKHVKYIHTKYMLVDPLDDDPIVITGSANFSKASTTNNDENMLIIRGDPRVADMYLGEFMRLYSHYRFRAFAQQKRERRGRPPAKLFLAEDDGWLAPYYDSGRIKTMERRLFA